MSECKINFEARGQTIENGSLEDNHLYYVELVENSVNGDRFSTIFNTFNNSDINASTVTSNANDMFFVQARIKIASGTLSLINAFFRKNGVSGKENANISISKIMLLV